MSAALLQPAFHATTQVVDPTGLPLVVYHGTPRPGLDDLRDPALDLSHSGARTDHGNFGKGVYTTRHEWVARGYAGREGSVIALYADLRNPIRIPVIDGGYRRLVEEWGEALGVRSRPIWEGSGQRSAEWSDEFRQKALAAGYDGVITLNIDGEICAEVVAFRPESLKTVKSVQTPMVEVGGHHLPLNPDGTVTLLHGTTAQAAKEILRSRILRAEAEPSVYLTTSAEAGYGDGTILEVDVRPDLLCLDDEFPDGRLDFAIHKPRVQVSAVRLHSECVPIPAL